MNKPRILLVDDLEENLIALAALLAQDGVDLLKARSGRQALELLLEHDDIALALLDVQMPEMDGFELAELMRGNQRTKDIPIIFVTAGATDNARVFKGYESGAVDFLPKPIEPQVLRCKAGVFLRLFRQQQQLAHELAERTEHLRLLELFNAVLGHDLRTPLSAISMAGMVLNKRADDDTSRRMATSVVSSARRMGAMIEDMLDVARIRRDGGFSLQPEPADLRPLIEAVVNEQQTVHADMRIEFNAVGDTAGRWDARRLAQVFANLLGNAVKHGTPGVPVTLTVDGTRDGSVVVGVGNGGAIAPGLLPHLFDPFRSGREQSGRGDGLGLGLYIAERIVAAHGGRIDVLAPAANRVEFRVELPRFGPA